MSINPSIINGYMKYEDGDTVLEIRDTKNKKSRKYSISGTKINVNEIMSDEFDESMLTGWEEIKGLQSRVDNLRQTVEGTSSSYFLLDLIREASKHYYHKFLDFLVNLKKAIDKKA